MNRARPMAARSINFANATTDHAHGRIVKLRHEVLKYDLPETSLIGREPRRRHTGSQPRSQGPLSSSFEKVAWLRLVTCLRMPTKAEQRVGPQLKFSQHCLGRWMLRCYTDVIYLKVKQVVCQRSCLTNASSLWSELLWVWDANWEGTLLIFQRIFKNRQRPASD